MVNLVRPFIQQFGEKILSFVVDYALNDEINQLRNIDKLVLGNFLETIQNLALRIYPQEKALQRYQEVEVKLSIICIKSNILEKQLFGMKVINNIEKRTRLTDLSQTKNRLAQLFKEKGLFSMIIKGHHSLIQTSHGIMKMLFSEDMVNDEELNELWEQIVKSDTETKNSLLMLLKESIFDFSKKEVLFFLEKMQEKASQIKNIELVHLLLKIKKMGSSKFFACGVTERANQVLWSIL